MIGVRGCLSRPHLLLLHLTRSLRLLRHVRERTEAAREQACAADAFPCAKETRGKEKCWARKNIASVRLDDSVACRLVVSVRIRRGGECDMRAAALAEASASPEASASQKKIEERTRDVGTKEK